MPELPEVETVKRTLNVNLKNKNYIINNVIINFPKIIKDIELNNFKEKLIGQTIKEVDRVGKHLLFVLNDYILISHLRMEGKYFFTNNRDEIKNKKHVLVEFELSDNNFLFYYDTRRFGTMHLGNYQNFYNLKPLTKLASEPWDIDENWFIDKVNKSRKAIKTIILDQHVVAGIGNIYADEILFKSKINPQERGNNLTKTEILRILENSKIILNQSIDMGGTTIKSFSAGKQISSTFQKWLMVHTKKDQPCPKCKNIILKTKVNGRGTYWCDHCQKLKK